MRKKTYCLMLLLISAFLYFPITANAMGFTAGATTWYVKWETPDEWVPDFDPTFAYGPVLSMQFNEDLGLSFVFLYGKFNDVVKDSTSKRDDTIKRYDGDLAINYNLNSYFKLFAGAKYISFGFDSVYSRSDGAGQSINVDHAAIGPAGGIGGTFPLGYDFFVLANVSIMYLWGNEETTGYTTDFIEYGVNTTASLAYYISAASTTVSLGGRYQILKLSYDKPDVREQVIGVTGKETHKFYGVTLSATYSFNI